MATKEELIKSLRQLRAQMHSTISIMQDSDNEETLEHADELRGAQAIVFTWINGLKKQV